MSVHPRTRRHVGGQSTAEFVDKHYALLKAEVTATVQSKLFSRKMRLITEDLEEAYNHAWHGVYEKLDAGVKIENLTGMLVLITWRRAVDIYRSNHPSEREDFAPERGIEPDLATEVDDREKLNRLISKLKTRLNQREREAVSLCLIHGYSRPEAAKLLNMPEPALKKVMDGAMKKIGGIVTSLSARGCGDEEWAGLMRSYAFATIEDDREFKRAEEHVEQCASCRRYVMGLRGLAAVVPPVGPVIALAGHGAGIFGFLHRLLAGTSRGAVLETGTRATAAAGGGGASMSTVAGGVALKGAAVALVAAAAITATTVHSGSVHPAHAATSHPRIVRPVAVSAGDLPASAPVYSPPVRRAVSDRSVTRRNRRHRRTGAVSASREFGPETPPSATSVAPVETQPARSRTSETGESVGAAEKEFGFER